MNSSAMPEPLQLGIGATTDSSTKNNPAPREDPRKDPKPKKTAKPNFITKASAKIKDASSLLTDAKTWAHRVEEERKKKPEDSIVPLSFNNCI